MKGKYIIVILMSICIISACGGNNNDKYEYYRFSKQVTPSGKYVIYDYARYGSMAFSSDIGGTELFDIDAEFKERKGRKIDGAISEWLSEDTLWSIISNLN